MRAILAVSEGRRSTLADGLATEGVQIIAAVAPTDPLHAAEDRLPPDETAALAAGLAEADVLVIDLDRTTVTEHLVSVCDRAGVRIVPLGTDVRLSAILGIEAPCAHDIEPWLLAESLSGTPGVAAEDPGQPRSGGRTVVVWGPAGAPGRSTVAVEIAVEIARGAAGVALVDADSHAPSLALTLGLPDEGPGFAAACRQAEVGGLDARELTRISIPLGRTGVDVLTGINRPSRWPELSETRVGAALEVCRSWVGHTVVDVAASLERDEEIVSDLDGPRRNAATLAALASADLVVAVTAADPVGVSRFLRQMPEVRGVVGDTPIAVVANRLRPGALGLDARGQVRRTLERFGGVRDVWFVPQDPRSADAALLSARSIAETAPRSPFTHAIRRFVGEAILPPDVAHGRRAA
ncbi:CpaE family protein [Microbacterium koreense]|uniref:CpaE family protein n=1 Tax=Microbacterium koreense TaxID=323761 RepID=A0ABW2ZTW2_9MICO